MRKQLVYLLISACTYSSSTRAAFTELFNESQFKNALARNEYTFVFAYHTHKGKDALFKTKIKRITESVKNLSKRTEYEIADIQFIKVAADDALWSSLASSGSDESILFALFEREAMIQKQGEPALILGDQTSVKLELFIDRFIGDYISRMKEREEKEQEEYEKEREKNKSNVNVYYNYNPYSYDAWGYPYYYNGWGYYGPRYSLGWGWSSGHRYSRGGGRRGYSRYRSGHGSRGKRR